MPDMRPITIELTAYYAVLPPEPRIDSRPPKLLLLLHGWGQRADRFIQDFIPLCARNVLVVAAQAPHQFYLDMLQTKVGFNWLTRYEKENSIRDVNGYLDRLLVELQASEPYDPSSVFVLGFSQGSSVAYRFALSGALRPAGLISCCSDLPGDAAQSLPTAHPFPVLLAHGKDDPLVPEGTPEAVERILTKNSFPCEPFSYPCGHEITPELVERIGSFLDTTPASP